MLLETERLVITELTMDMAQAIHENSLDEDNRNYVPDEVFETVEDAAEVIEWLMEQYGAFEGPLLYAMITKDTDDNVGYVQMVPIDDECTVWELGYHVGKKYTGNGYATEAVMAFLPVMTERIGITEVYGICVKENAASHRVMEKCGFVNEFAGVGPYQGEEREIIKNVWRA